MMNYDEPPKDENFSTHQHTSQLYDRGWDTYEDAEKNNNDYEFAPSRSSNPNPSIMDISPDTSFSALDSPSIFANRHAPLPSQVSLDNSPNDSTRMRQEISLISSTHKNLTDQLGSVLKKLDSFSSPSEPSPSK
jgi:hypothetical protein